MPIASVIMPCYNHAAFIEQSIRAVLAQTMADLELIVVDDASTDCSVDFVRRLAGRDPRVRILVHEKNAGASRSRNDALRASQGEYIGFCDADDIWRPEKLKLQVELLRANPTYDVTYCESEFIDEKGQSRGKLFRDVFPPPQERGASLFEQLSQTNFINMQTVILRRACIDEGEYFDEGIKWVEDWWQWIRLSRKHRFLYDSRVLAQYRTHSGSTGLTQKRGYRVNRWKVGKRILRSYSDLPPHARAAVFYNMGNDLCRIRKSRIGRRFLRQALALAIRGKGSLKITARMAARLALESCWRR